jgi:hypothetical protein
MGLGTYLLGLGGWAVFVLPFAFVWWLLLAELWLCAEAVLLAVSGILVLADLARRQIRFADITVMRLRWGLFVVAPKGARQ